MTWKVIYTEGLAKYEQLFPANKSTLIPLIFAQHECVKINSRQNRAFFAHLGAQKLMVREFFKYYFEPEFDDIIQYFSPP